MVCVGCLLDTLRSDFQLNVQAKKITKDDKDKHESFYIRCLTWPFFLVMLQDKQRASLRLINCCCEVWVAGDGRITIVVDMMRFRAVATIHQPRPRY